MKAYGLFILVITLSLISCSTQDSTNQENTESTIGNNSNLDPYQLGINAEKGLPSGLKAGSKAPGFAGRDIYGEPFDLYGVLAEQPVVLLFYRGNWCPYCNKQMANLKDSIQLMVNKLTRQCYTVSLNRIGDITLLNGPGKLLRLVAIKKANLKFQNCQMRLKPSMKSVSHSILLT